MLPDAVRRIGCRLLLEAAGAHRPQAAGNDEASRCKV